MSTNNCTYLACHETACFAKRYTQAESWKREKLRIPRKQKGNSNTTENTDKFCSIEIIKPMTC